MSYKLMMIINGKIEFSYNCTVTKYSNGRYIGQVIRIIIINFMLYKSFNHIATRSVTLTCFLLFLFFLFKFLSFFQIPFFP